MPWTPSAGMGSMDAGMKMRTGSPSAPAIVSEPPSENQVATLARFAK